MRLCQWRILDAVGGHPGRGPTSVFSNFFSGEKIMSYDRATSANSVYLLRGLNAMYNGHSFGYACGFENLSFNINLTRHAARVPCTLQ